MGLFFNLPKHRVFNYQPVFYDPKKEDLDARIAKAEREKAEAEGKEKEPYVPGEYIKRNFRSNYEKGTKVSGKENVFSTSLTASPCSSANNPDQEHRNRRPA